MSRCYPFPPPGYERNETRDESLIESIKGAKEEVKKDRKHKKEKKRKERENDADRSKKHSHKRRHKDESANASKKVDDHSRLINSEVEFLEKSCLTVELELQTTSQSSCDSTLRSNERKQSQSQSQPLDGRHNDSETSICKGESEVMMASKDQQQCSSRERLLNEAPRDALRVCQEKRRDSIFGSSSEIKTKVYKDKKTIPLKDNRNVGKEKMPSSSLCTHPEQEKPSSSHRETIGPSKPLLCSKCTPSVAVHFLNLIENWTPDRVESKLTDSEDQEWWLFMKFGTKRHHQVSNQKTTSQGSSSMMLCPTARFLPEAELHALPFTVPF